MGKKLEVAGWKKMSCDDGPGMRSVLFLQGCSMDCEGCHNKIAQKRGNGELRDVVEIADSIIQKCHNKRLTISGGEPLEQWEALKELVTMLADRGFDICIYTGWSKDKIPDEVFQMVNYVKIGSFVAALKSDNIHYVGSSNQRMFKRETSGEWVELNLQIV